MLSKIQLGAAFRPATEGWMTLEWRLWSRLVVPVYGRPAMLRDHRGGTADVYRFSSLAVRQERMRVFGV